MKSLGLSQPKPELRLIAGISICKNHSMAAHRAARPLALGHAPSTQTTALPALTETSRAVNLLSGMPFFPRTPNRPRRLASVQGSHEAVPPNFKEAAALFSTAADFVAFL